MNNIILPRDEQPPVRIRGELIGHGENKLSPSGLENKRWTECSIYETDKSEYVAHVVGRSLVEGESDRNWVAIASTPRALATKIEARFGRFHLAVQTAFQRAGIWEQAASEVCSVDSGEDQYCALVFSPVPQRIEVKARREGAFPVEIRVANGSQSLDIEEAEKTIMTMIDAVSAARKWSGDAL